MPHGRSIIGALCSVLLLWWTLRDIDLAAVAGILRASDTALFALATVSGTAIVGIRARKWRPILEPVAGRVPFGPLWRSAAIGVMVNNVVPLRAGEVARAFALSREAPTVPMTTALGTLVVDRLFDVLVVVLMLGAAMLGPDFPAHVTVAGRTMGDLARLGVGVAGTALAACYVVALRPAWITGAAGALAARVSPRQRDVVVGAVELAVSSLAVLRDGRRFAAILLWTILHWGTHALSFWLAFRAVGIEVPASAALFLQGIIAIGVAVPSSPGFFGVFEAAATVGLAVYGVPKDLAVSWALAYHLLTFVPITVIGAVYFARLGMNLRDVTRSPSTPSTTA